MPQAVVLSTMPVQSVPPPDELEELMLPLVLLELLLTVAVWPPVPLPALPPLPPPPQAPSAKAIERMPAEKRIQG
jgi:hypothetical protein